MARALVVAFLLAALLGISAVSGHTVVWCLGRDALLNEVVAMGSYHQSTESGWNSATVVITSFNPALDGWTTMTLNNWILEPTSGADSSYFGCGFDCTNYCGNYDVTGIRTWQVKVLPQGTFSPGTTYEIDQSSTNVVDTPWSGCGNANAVYPILPPLGVDSITCPGDQSITMTSSCQAIASWAPASVTCTAACPSSVCSSNQIGGQTSGTNFPAGTNTITYQLLLDTLPATETCSFDIIVTDPNTPTISGCPSDQTICGPSPQTVSWTPPTATDCAGSVGVAGSHTPGSSFTSGTTTVTYQASNSAGSSTCTFDITVYSNSASITCPSDVTLTQTAGCSAVSTWSTSCTPPCITQTCSVSQTGGDPSGSNYAVGTTTNSFSLLIDGTPNGMTCDFDVVVNDVTAPALSGCPADITQCGPAGTSVSWTPPTFTDCQAVTTTSTHSPGDSFPLGTTTVTYTATAGGLSTSCSFDVFLYINTATITCPPSQSVVQTAGCSAVATWADPTCTTQCTYQTCSTSQSLGPASGSNFAVGSNPIQYDLSIDGNPTGDQCNFGISVTDVTPPVMTGCPGDQSACGGAGTTFTWTPPSFTDCQTISVTNSHNSGDGFPLGTTTVTYTATDLSNLSTTCSFDITVFNNPPTITCPSDFTVSTAQASGSGPGMPAMTFTTSYSVTASDSCGNSLGVVQTAGVSGMPAVIPFSSLPMTFTFETAADPVNGQQDTCSFTVSGVFAQVSSVLQSDTYRFGDIYTPPPNGVAELGLYVNTTLCWELFNTPAVGDMGTFVITDAGSNIMHSFVTLDGAASFPLSEPGSCMTFLGPHQIPLGDYYAGVMGTSTLLANNWPDFELVAIADQFQAPPPTV